MKVSEINSDNVAEYLRLDDIPSSLDMYISGAKAFVASYPGLTGVELDEHEDITLAIMVIIQDMYDNRSMYVDKSNINKVVESVLNMHRRNLVI